MRCNPVSGTSAARVWVAIAGFAAGFVAEVASRPANDGRDSASAAGASTLYFEDFDDGLAQDWLEDSDSLWNVEAGEYVRTGNSGRELVALYGGGEWNDFTVSVACRATGNGGARIVRLLVRASDALDVDYDGYAYFFQIDSLSRQFSVFKHLPSSGSEALQGWSSNNAILTGTNTLKATVVGDRLYFLVNGVLVWSGVDPDIAGGRVGVSGYRTGGNETFFFDDVRVTLPEDPLGPSPTPTLSPTPSPSPSPSPTPSPTPTPIPGALSNLSTRGQVGRFDAGQAMIGGFIVAGGGARRMLVTGAGPDLGSFGIEGFLGDPALAIFDGQTILGVNNDWMESADAATILATGFAPNDPRESAVLLDLAPGAYTALLAGAAFGTGVGLVQAFDLGPAPGAADDSRPVNLSTRVLVGADERATIAGFTIEGEAQARVLVRALGPTIGAEPFSVPGTLADPEVRVFTAPPSGEPVELAYNDDWTSPSVPAQSIEELGFAPDSESESAVLLHLGAGAYTAVVSGVGPDEAARSGVALVEIYEIAP